MTIRLEAPAYRPGGPDGQGWNRLSLNAHMGAMSDQCALRPRSYATLVDSLDTRRARWGGHGRCTGDGDCGTCPVLTGPSRTLRAFADRVLVRLWRRLPIDDKLGAPVPPPQPMVMEHPERGWASTGYGWSWEDLSRLVGWEIDGPYRDDDSEGFWLRKVNPKRYDGLPDCTHGYLNRDHCRDCRRGATA